MLDFGSFAISAICLVVAPLRPCFANTFSAAIKIISSFSSRIFSLLRELLLAFAATITLPILFPHYFFMKPSMDYLGGLSNQMLLVKLPYQFSDQCQLSWRPLRYNLPQGKRLHKDCIQHIHRR